jgi:hypothetical protein
MPIGKVGVHAVVGDVAGERDLAIEPPEGVQ